MSQLRRYLRLFGGSRRLLTWSLLVSMLQLALLIPIPLAIKHLFDSISGHGRAGGVVLGGVIVLTLYLASSALGLWTRYSVLKATKRAVGELRCALFAKIYSLPLSFHDRQDREQLHATIVQDSERLDIVANAVLGLMLPAAIVSLGLAAVALYLDPLLFALLAVALPVMVVVVRRLSGRLRVRTRTWQLAFERFSAQAQRALRSRALAEVRGADQVELARHRARIEALSAAGLEMAWRQSALAIIQNSIVAAAAVLVLVVGGTAVASGHMTFGELLSFYAVVALLQGQVGTFASLLPVAISGRTSLDRLDEIFDAHEPPPYRGTRPIAFRGSIELQGVSFGYGAQPLLSEIDLRIEPGEHLVIVGPNGGGKSTLASLILGLYSPWSGELRADGIPYSELDMRRLRGTFGVVLQDPVILPGTVAENIAYGRPEATPDEVEQAATVAGVDAFLSALPNGYETQVGAEGLLLSGGQRQRVAIARALLGDPRLLILDEPTTHLDESSVARLQGLLAARADRPTVIVITHDELLARQAERVVHMHQGRLSEGVIRVPPVSGAPV